MDGNMRRLPPWMIAGASSGVTATGNRTDNKSVVGEIKHEAEAPKTKKKRRTRRDTDDSEEPKKMEKIRRRGRNIKEEEDDNKPSIGGGKNHEEEEDLTVDDLLNFAQEYVRGEVQDQARQSSVSFSTSSESMVVDVNDESNMKASQGETRDPTSDDMINLLLGPFFNTRK